MYSDLSSYYAPPQRDDSEKIQSELKQIMDNPLLDNLLISMGGLIAVLNEKRQILMVNKSLLKQLGISDIKCILGQRLGEAVNCVHAHDMPGGCGTSAHCASCGAVIAMELTRLNNRASEMRCHIEQDDKGRIIDLSFSVRTSPVCIEGIDLILITLRDISSEERWSILEKTFFHDLNNSIASITGYLDIMELDDYGKNNMKLQLLRNAARKLTDEVAIHRVLCEDKGYENLTHKENFSIDDITEALELMYFAHPVGKGKTLEIDRKDSNQDIYSNKTLVLRVLGNMLTNAFEASGEGSVIRLTTEDPDGAAVFSVWNESPIPEEIALRIFQRNYSSKAESGRGLGTFGMKLFGERILRGEIGFITSPEEGTVFRFKLPLNVSDIS